ncbi:hypothetical protein RMATCC62417_10660 [Rhizopus microsporus]|nr:hypothetical protein RMATCC62417_10660 [Rhizopus microsporus]
MANLNSSCLYWSGLNGTYNCILGEANEPNNCGFQGASDACNYCKTNGTDACCKSVKCSSLSPGEIAGIVIGCLLFIAIIGALAYFYFYKKKRGQQVKHHRQSKKPYHDNSSVLGYESLASQRILVPNNHHHPNGYQQHPFIPNNNGNKPPPLSIQPPPPLEEFYEVKHPYPPQMGDELGLHVGDIVCVAMNFDDGWALGFNVTTGLKGVFPLVCVSPAPEELLEELLLQQQQQEESSTKILVEENNSSIGRTMSRSNRTLPKSELTQHKNIPKRTASIMRSYDYRESDSPTSPTLNTPFFDSHNISQPEPSFHNVNDNSSNNNSNNHHSHQEVIELHRK